jgi:serine/threonine protein phosphatase PrpC
MEDEFFVAEGGRFVAVFDGHGGGGVSQFLKHHLYDAVCQHLRQGESEEASTSPQNEKTNPTPSHSARSSGNGAIPSVISHATALKTAFAQIEEAVLVDETLNYQGSTAVAVYMHEYHGHRTLLSANVGDSRAVLSRHGRAVDLTRDHKPNDERERARILAMGETIEWDRLSQVHRVRNLSLSRAIGDRFAKPVVSGDVEINHFPVMEDADEFIILASDGLWDAMTSEEVVSFVHQTIESELSSANIAKDDISNYKLVLRRNMAKFVAREAIRRGSCDNVCVIMVWLNDLSQT